MNIENWPKSPKNLLQARYDAFVRGDVDFIMESHHPETQNQIEREAVESWSLNSKWKGLEVSQISEEDQDKCFIHFTVTYERKYETTYHSEIAEFRKHEGRWYYYDSEFPKPETIKRGSEKLGRNDPCHCGSGKKYKKCHGKAA